MLFKSNPYNHYVACHNPPLLTPFDQHFFKLFAPVVTHNVMILNVNDICPEGIIVIMIIIIIENDHTTLK